MIFPAIDRIMTKACINRIVSTVAINRVVLGLRCINLITVVIGKFTVDKFRICRSAYDTIGWGYNRWLC